jgi:anti-sigma B factor antagonist
MDIQFEQLPDQILTIHLSGRMDLAGTGEIEERLTANALMNDRARVVVDLSQVTYIASLGLGSLVRTAQAVERRHGRLVMLNPQPLVAKLLDESGIGQHIHVFDSIAAAVNYLSRLPKTDE